MNTVAGRKPGPVYNPFAVQVQDQELGGLITYSQRFATIAEAEQLINKLRQEYRSPVIRFRAVLHKEPEPVSDWIAGEAA